ncbi:SGNH/GDSL hydrolase family protein [Microbacterium saperdae]
MQKMNRDLPAAVSAWLRPLVDAAELRHVAREHATLGPFSTELGVGRTVPRGIMIPFRGGPSLPARQALDVGSLVVRDRRDGTVLIAEQDYVVDPTYGSICLPEHAEERERHVTLTYTYSLSRLDRLERSADGQLGLVAGVGHLSAPRPPRLREGGEHVALVFVPHFADAGEYEVFTPADRRSPWPASHGRLPALRARIAEGKALRVLFLGDSITEGGDASTDRDTFTAVATRSLEQGLDGVAVGVTVVAKGGSTSAEWLDDEGFPECDWSRVEAAQPDVTIVEFLNDVDLTPGVLPANYGELIRRLRAIGSEIVLTTPPFTIPETMGDPDHRGIDDRPYVRWLRAYAAEEGIPLIDVSRRWEQLVEEGIPYWTLLVNGLNHPDDRGHEMAGELIADGIQEMLARSD